MAERKQRSLFWIISTIYLTTGLSGSILAAIFVFAGAIVVSGAPHPIYLSVLFLLRLTGFLLGLKMGVNYVCDRAFVKKEDVFKISIAVATIPIVFLALFVLTRGFTSADITMSVQSIIIFFAARYFLGKRISQDMPQQETRQITKPSSPNRKIIIVALIGLLIIGVIFTLKYIVIPKEGAQQIGITKWKEYALEEITQDFQSPSFMDKRLIGIKDDGRRDVIVQSMKELMDWEKIPGGAGFYPVKVSFPSYSAKIFFVKYMVGTGHSAGFFMLDVDTLEFKQLTEVGSIYENYYNYLSVISPDGLKIASYGNSDLYLLDLLQDKATLLVKAQAGETFYLTAETPQFQWLNNNTIQYPVHSLQNIYVSPEIREITLAATGETANWKTYNNEQYGFEIKYPQEWSVEVILNEVDIKNNKSHSLISIIKNENPRNLSLDEWFKETTIIGERRTLKAAATPVFINGVKAYRLDSEIEPPNPLFEIVGIADAQKRIFSLYAYSGQANDNENLEKILSTLRFIEEKENSYIKVISPNGGEKWVLGQTAKILYTVNSLAANSGVRISLHTSKDIADICYSFDIPASQNIPNDQNEVFLILDNRIQNCKTPGEYKIIASTELGYDQSDNYFSVVADGEVADWDTYRNGEYSFEVQYPISIFIPVQAASPLPPDYRINYDAVKLISVSRINKLGKAECRYGESGLTSICEAAMEGGIGFIPVDDSLNNLTSLLDSSLKENILVGGKQSIRYSMGAEGEGTDYYYIPLSGSRTLVIQRLYRSDGFPGLGIFNQILSTFKFLD